MSMLVVALLLGFAQAENILAQPKGSKQGSLVEASETSMEGAGSKLLAEQAAEDSQIAFEDKMEEETFKEKQSGLALPMLRLAKMEDLKVAKDKCGRFVELLENPAGGASYVGKMYINGQKLDTIWDTGSDEPVVNSVATLNLKKPCFDAFHNPVHDCYNKFKSDSYKALAAFPESITYGSGDTFVLPGFDDISFLDNQCAHPGVKFQELVETDIPQIIGHEIDAVGGLGPKKFEPLNFASQMGVDRFSFCFMSNTTQPGQLIWNDHPAHENPGFKFTTMPNKGKEYWSVKASDFTLVAPGKDSKKVGCVDKECFCVVDSGTSLITLDQNTLKEVETILNDFEKNTGMKCNEQNLKQFPTIKFYLDGHEHHFKPEDYLMYTDVDEIPEHISKALHFTSALFPWLKEPQAKKECVMMFTPPMEDGLCILGMPFFRNYYVTMDRTARTISTAAHDGFCRPAKPSFMQSDLKPTMKHIDIRHATFSKAYHQLSKHQGPFEHIFTHAY